MRGYCEKCNTITSQKLKFLGHRCNICGSRIEGTMLEVPIITTPIVIKSAAQNNRLKKETMLKAKYSSDEGRELTIQECEYEIFYFDEPISEEDKKIIQELSLEFVKNFSFQNSFSIYCATNDYKIIKRYMERHY